MRRLTWPGRLVVPALVALVMAGCGGARPTASITPADYSALAKQKVEVVRKMADGLSDPSGVAVLGAYEEFVNIPLDVKEHPTEAREILDIYNKRLRGKLKGETADQMQREMNRFQTELAKVK